MITTTIIYINFHQNVTNVENPPLDIIVIFVVELKEKEGTRQISLCLCLGREGGQKG